LNPFENSGTIAGKVIRSFKPFVCSVQNVRGIKIIMLMQERSDSSFIRGSIEILIVITDTLEKDLQRIVQCYC
jgi:hypothetical protein